MSLLLLFPGQGEVEPAGDPAVHATASDSAYGGVASADAAYSGASASDTEG